MALERITAPTTYPVDLPILHEHLRLSHTDEDALLLDYLRAACAYVEQQTRRALMSQQWRLSLECWPSSTALIELPRPPLASVESITYIGAAGLRNTVAAEQYATSSPSPLPGVAPIWGEIWPAARPERDSVQITYSAGYADAQDVPADLCNAILLLIAHWYENREASTLGNLSEPPYSVEALLSSHRIYSV